MLFRSPTLSHSEGGYGTPFQRYYTDLPVRTAQWAQTVEFYWHLRTLLPNRMLQKESPEIRNLIVVGLQAKRRNRFLSGHLQFLLEKAAHSDDIVGLARRKVFRFGYLYRNHPSHMKKAIFALAAYIQRVTGEEAEVRACQSIWGHDG